MRIAGRLGKRAEGKLLVGKGGPEERTRGSQSSLTGKEGKERLRGVPEAEGRGLKSLEGAGRRARAKTKGRRVSSTIPQPAVLPLRR